MPLTFNEIDFKVDLPDIPRTSPVATHVSPCLKEHDETTRAIAKVLDIDVRGTAQVPHGYAIGQQPRPGRGLRRERRGPRAQHRAAHGIRG